MQSTSSSGQAITKQEYEALLAGVRIANGLHLPEVLIFSDKSLAKKELEECKIADLELIKKEQNKEVDTLAHLGANLSSLEERWIKI